jgi:hypothetical protein
VIHFILPHMVILMMNGNIVCMDRNDLGDRNSVTLTLLLTTVAFQFLLVPEVSTAVPARAMRPRRRARKRMSVAED